MINTTSSQTPGERLVELCRQTKRELVLVAPYMKVSVVDSLLCAIKDGIRLICVTRWHPAEIAVGVSDLEVYKSVKNYEGHLWLRQDLHAKYYRSDDLVMIGSANLTRAALGWSIDSNLEILQPVDNSRDDLDRFEEKLLRKAVMVDDDLFCMMTAAASDWSSMEEPRVAQQALSNLEQEWIPVLRDPASLFLVYCNDDIWTLPASTLEAGRSDLAMIQLPRGLSRNQFNRTVGAALLTMPIVNLVDSVVVSPQRFGTVRDLLRERLDISHQEAARAWQTLIRWLRYFLPDRYTYGRPGYSEIIARADVAGVSTV